MKTHAFLFLTGDEVFNMALIFLLSVGLLFWLAEKVWIGLTVRKMEKETRKRAKYYSHPAYKIPSRRNV